MGYSLAYGKGTLIHWVAGITNSSHMIANARIECAYTRMRETPVRSKKMNESLPTLEASVRDALRARLRGNTLVPGDREYDTVRQVWNGAIDRRPSCIIR